MPVFYVETLADLEKEVAAGSTPEALVGRLAGKTPSSAYPNLHHSASLLSELGGQPVPMRRQVVINAGTVMRDPDGRLGVHVEQFPEQAALLRWQQHDFLALEREMAKGWRAELAAHDPAHQVTALGQILPADRKIPDRVRLKAFVDELCQRSDPEMFVLAL